MKLLRFNMELKSTLQAVHLIFSLSTAVAAVGSGSLTLEVHSKRQICHAGPCDLGMETQHRYADSKRNVCSIIPRNCSKM